MPENLESDQMNRLWEHRLHIDDAFYTRLNFFLVFESVLLGTVGVLDSRSKPPILMLRVLDIFGLMLTIIWGYIQARHKYILDDMNARAKDFFPEYRATLESRQRVKWPITGRSLLAYVVPSLVALIWITFFFFL